jgi:hypothetical protein
MATDAMDGQQRVAIIGKVGHCSGELADVGVLEALPESPVGCLAGSAQRRGEYPGGYPG